MALIDDDLDTIAVITAGSGYQKAIAPMLRIRTYIKESQAASTNNRSDEIAFLESCIQFTKGPGVLWKEDDLLVIRLLERIAQLRTVR